MEIFVDLFAADASCFILLLLMLLVADNEKDVNDETEKKDSRIFILPISGKQRFLQCVTVEV